jgi:hypothetical protein
MIMPFNLKLKRREKIVLLSGCVIALVIISYQVVLWTGSVRASTGDKTAAMMMLLERQINMIAGKEEMNGKLESARKEIANLEKGLLSSHKPAVAAAELQKTLNEMTMPLNLEINSEKVLSPVDQDVYIGIPVEIGFVSSTAILKNILMQIASSQLLLSVPEIRIRVMDMRNPKEISVTMTVMGFARKEVKEDEKLYFPGGAGKGEKAVKKSPNDS